MSFQLHERYQCHCQYCNTALEGDAATEAVLRVEEHEQGCLKNPNRVITVVAPLSPPSFVISASDAREIVRITPEGEVIVNPGFTTAEAAHAFWEAVQKIAAEHRGPQ